MMTGMMMKTGLQWKEVSDLEFHIFTSIYKTIVEFLKGPSE